MSSPRSSIITSLIKTLCGYGLAFSKYAYMQTSHITWRMVARCRGGLLAAALAHFAPRRARLSGKSE